MSSLSEGEIVNHIVGKKNILQSESNMTNSRKYTEYLESIVVINVTKTDEYDWNVA